MRVHVSLKIVLPMMLILQIFSISVVLCDISDGENQSVPNTNNLTTINQNVSSNTINETMDISAGQTSAGAISAAGADSISDMDFYNQALGAAVADTFDYPIGTPRSRSGTGYVTQANDGDGWYNAQDWQDYNSDYGGYHPGEDWNDERGGSSDVGAPVYAIASGVVNAITSNVPGEGIAIKPLTPRFRA